MNPFSSALGLLIIASICYGVNAPIMKMAATTGATPSGMTLSYGIGMIIISFLMKGEHHFFTSKISILWSMPMGIICGLAFISIGKAFGLGASVALTTVIITAHPIIACLISGSCMGEWKIITNIQFIICASIIGICIYVISKIPVKG